MTEVRSKEGEQIHEGDRVWTRFRGGRHEGDVWVPYLVLCVLC